MRALVKDEYNQSEFSFGAWSLYVRAYNDSMAYRFASKFEGEIKVKSETFELKFEDELNAVCQPTFGTRADFECFTVLEKVGKLKDIFASCLPYIVEKQGYKISVLESGTWDYPSMRVNYPKDAKSPQGWWSNYPKKSEVKSAVMTAVEFEDYIAKTSGSRSFPWRILFVARTDAELIDNDAVCRLAEKSKLEDASWVKGGVSVWDWWNDWSLEGVDFKTGMNNETLKYYIDFAAKVGAQFSLIDEGWLEGNSVVTGKFRVDMKMLADYAKSKNVRLLVWVRALHLLNDAEEAMKKISELGIAGMKIDFIEHDDQIANDFHWKMAELAAKYKLLVDYHGCYRPNGLNRAYPNVLTFEGGRGNEYNKMKNPSLPVHDVNLVFTRMQTGPYDYTPGAMRNVNLKDFAPSNANPPAVGTRAHQLAMFVLYFSPLQVMCDSPTAYEKYLDTAKFIATVPTVWDETVVLSAKLNDFAVLARRSGEIWYICGMAADSDRDVKIELSKLLKAGQKYEAEIFTDTQNSYKTAQDCKREVKELSSKDSLDIKMTKGGGFVMKLSKK